MPMYFLTYTLNGATKAHDSCFATIDDALICKRGLIADHFTDVKIYFGWED